MHLWYGPIQRLCTKRAIRPPPLLGSPVIYHLRAKCIAPTPTLRAMIPILAPWGTTTRHVGMHETMGPRGDECTST